MSCGDLKYLHCDTCSQSRPDGEAMRDYARLSVAVTPEGGLLVTCVRHDELVAHIKNADLSRILGEVALQPCGCAHDKKETLH